MCRTDRPYGLPGALLRHARPGVRAQAVARVWLPRRASEAREQEQQEHRGRAAARGAQPQQHVLHVRVRTRVVRAETGVAVHQRVDRAQSVRARLRRWGRPRLGPPERRAEGACGSHPRRQPAACAGWLLLLPLPALPSPSRSRSLTPPALRGPAGGRRARALQAAGGSRTHGPGGHRRGRLWRILGDVLEHARRVIGWLPLAGTGWAGAENGRCETRGVRACFCKLRCAELSSGFCAGCSGSWDGRSLMSSAHCRLRMRHEPRDAPRACAAGSLGTLLPRHATCRERFYAVVAWACILSRARARCWAAAARDHGRACKLHAEGDQGPLPAFAPSVPATSRTVRTSGGMPYAGARGMVLGRPVSSENGHQLSARTYELYKRCATAAFGPSMARRLVPA